MVGSKQHNNKVALRHFFFLFLYTQMSGNFVWNAENQEIISDFGWCVIWLRAECALYTVYSAQTAILYYWPCIFEKK